MDPRPVLHPAPRTTHSALAGLRDELIEFVLDGLGPRPLVADLGAGTGISSQTLRRACSCRCRSAYPAVSSRAGSLRADGRAKSAATASSSTGPRSVHDRTPLGKSCSVCETASRRKPRPRVTPACRRASSEFGGPQRLQQRAIRSRAQHRLGPRPGQATRHCRPEAGPHRSAR